LPPGRAQSRARFDWNGDGVRDATGWVGQGDGFLTLDRNRDGTVSGGNELSFVDDKAGAKSDLDGLSAFDSDRDGMLSVGDLAWNDFHVWRDDDGDGTVDAGEYLSMAEAGIASIGLTGAATERTWGWEDNIVINNGSFTRTDGASAALADVALNYSASPGRPVAPVAPLVPVHRPDLQDWGERWSNEAVQDRWDQGSSFANDFGSAPWRMPAGQRRALGIYRAWPDARG